VMSNNSHIEIADKIAGEFALHLPNTLCERLSDRIAIALRAAVEADRERCAKLAYLLDRINTMHSLDDPMTDGEPSPSELIDVAIAPYRVEIASLRRAAERGLPKGSEL
jgi:hypothetical protein